MLHPNEARVGITEAQKAAAGQVEYAIGDKVHIRYPDGVEADGEVIGPAFETTNASGKKVRLVPVYQDRQFWSGQVALQNVLAMDVFLTKKDQV